MAPKLSLDARMTIICGSLLQSEHLGLAAEAAVSGGHARHRPPHPDLAPGAAEAVLPNRA
jgi:hypothetical protein